MESAKNTGKGALIERIRDLIENKDFADPLVYHEIDAPSPVSSLRHSRCQPFTHGQSRW